MPTDDRYRAALGTRARAFIPDEGGDTLTPVAFRSPPKSATFGWVEAHAEIKGGPGGISGVLVLAVDSNTRGTVDPTSLRIFRWNSDERRFTLVESSGCDDGALVWGRIDAAGKYAAIGLNTHPAALATIRMLAAMRELPGMAEAERGALHEQVCELLLCSAEASAGQPNLCAACRALASPFDLPEFELLPHSPVVAQPATVLRSPEEHRSRPLEADAFPAEGGVSAMALDPVAPGRLYVAAESGGIWRLDGLADDSAAPWVALGELGTRVVHAVAVAAPVDDQIVYVADESGAVMRSRDRGATWGTPSKIRFRHVWRIAIDPADPESRVRRIAVLRSGPSRRRRVRQGLWESADGGCTWMEVLTGDTIDAAVDPDDSSILYAAVRDEGLCLSLRSGRGWIRVMPFVSAAVHGGSMIRVALGRATGGAGRTVAVRFGQELFVNRHGGRARRQPDGGPWVSIGERGGDGTRAAPGDRSGSVRRRGALDRRRQPRAYRSGLGAGWRRVGQGRDRSQAQDARAVAGIRLAAQGCRLPRPWRWHPGVDRRRPHVGSNRSARLRAGGSGHERSTEDRDRDPPGCACGSRQQGASGMPRVRRTVSRPGGGKRRNGGGDRNGAPTDARTRGVGATWDALLTPLRDSPGAHPARSRSSRSTTGSTRPS